MKARYRIERGWFGRSRVVLQVGYKKAQSFSYMFPNAFNIRWVWRDATEEDLIDRALGTPGPARLGVDILLGRTATPEPCPGDKAQDSSTETKST